MSIKQNPRALKLADWLDRCKLPYDPQDVSDCAAELRRLAAVEAERDALRYRLDGAVKAAEQVFGEKAIRYKFSLNKNGRPYVTLPPEMDGRWYALQPAEDDAHIGLCDEIVRLRAELAAAKAQVLALSKSTYHMGARIADDMLHAMVIRRSPDGMVNVLMVEKAPVDTLKDHDVIMGSRARPLIRPAVPDVEAAAKALAEVMDYPWEHMPEQGRAQMRKNVEAILQAALPQPEVCM